MCYYGDGPDFYSERTPRARKPHRCFECGRTIPTGDTYRLIAGKWDGEFDQYRIHAECYALAERLGDLMCGGEWAFGQVLEHLTEAGINWETGALDPEPFVRLADDVRREVAAAWMEGRQKYADATEAGR